MYPNSSLLTSVFVPDFFDTKVVSTKESTLVKDKDFTFEYSVDGLLSIIKLNKVPYLDLSKYDHQRRQWYSVDQYENLWRKYDPGDWIIETDSFYTLPGLYDPTGIDLSRYYSVYDLSPLSYLTTTTAETNGLTLKVYSPISINVNDLEVLDITDYSKGTNIVPILNTINPDDNKEFYFDKNTTIYTNQDFSQYSDTSIIISYHVNVDKINVKFRMNTNTTELSSYTPTVDFFVVKLTGQNI